VGVGANSGVHQWRYERSALNPVQTLAPVVNRNTSNSTSGDVVVGYLANPSNPAASINTQYFNQSNTVQVQVRKTLASANGAVPYFFARALGLTNQDMQATATAALINNVGGFQTPSNGGNIQILPFALDKQTWDDMLAGGATITGLGIASTNMWRPDRMEFAK
jgi:hypothetical protein